MWLLLGLCGIVAGSVANALIYRLPRDISWFAGRSICPKCKHVLSLSDLIPVVSWLLLRNRCRYCHSPIGKRHIFVELLMGAGFTVISNFQFPIFTYGILWITTIIAVMDWESMLVSDWLVGIWAVLVIVGGGASILGGLVGLGIMGIIWAITKGKAMGSGDIGISSVLGLWLGFPKIINALWMAFVAGGIYGAYLLVFRKAKLKTAVAFGPFLIIAGWIAYTVNYGFF